MERVSKLIKDVINWLNKPYYYNNSSNFKIKASFGTGSLVFIILVLFRPVNINIITINPYLFKLGFALITVCNLLFFFFVIEKIFKNFFRSENWTVGKHFFIIIALITFSSFIRWIYLYTFFPLEIKNNNLSLIKMMFYSFITATFPVITFIYFDEKYRSKKYVINDDELKKKENTKIGKIYKNKTVTIYATNKKDSLTFNLRNLIYIYSESNYSCIILEDKNKEFKEEILRVPLHIIEKELNTYHQIFRCHKSYIVNTNYVNNISGNARGYSLHLKDNIKQIPVSRKFTKRQLQDAV